MHGLILVELKKYVESKLGTQAWGVLMTKAGLGQRHYISAQTYPDADVVALVAAASAITGHPVPALLEDFGAFIVPDLVGLYGALLDPSWKTLDVIERTEYTIHRVVRLRNPGASPPELECTRISASEVRIFYTSPRKMCSVAKGIVRGLAAHFGEAVSITEDGCMNEGADRCVLAVSYP